MNVLVKDNKSQNNRRTTATREPVLCVNYKPVTTNFLSYDEFRIYDTGSFPKYIKYMHVHITYFTISNYAKPRTLVFRSVPAVINYKNSEFFMLVEKN